MGSRRLLLVDLPLRSRCLLAGLALAVLHLVACGATLDADSAFHDGAVDDSDGPDSEDGDTSIDTDTHLDLEWWSLDGQLILAEGELVPDESVFTVGLRFPDQALACETARPVASATPEDASAHGLHLLWQLTLGEGEGCHQAPSGFGLGIGPYDRQLDPALAGSGLDGDALYGLYVRPNGGKLYVIGVAGTEEQLAGTAPEAPPVADGTYQLKGLHLLPLTLPPPDASSENAYGVCWAP